MRKQLLPVLLLFPLLLQAQKVDLDKFKFTAQFRTLPALNVDSTYRTFNVSVEGTKLMQGYLADLSPETSVFIDGWRKLEKRGHLDIHLRLEDLLPESFSVKERDEIVKDRTGKEVSRKKLYWQEVVYTFSASADVSDYRGAFIKKYQLSDRGYKQVYRGPEFAIRQMAEGYFLLNSLTLTGQLYRNCVNRATSNLTQQVTRDFGYGEVTVTDHMWILDSKKHPEYRAHRQAFQSASEALFSMSAHEPLGDLRQRLQPVINYFDGIKRRYTSTNKHDRKLRYASYYNLAVIYYYLDDPQAMQREASGLIMNDFDARDGKAFESTAMYLKNLFTQSGYSTRHFPIDTMQFKGPSEKAVIAAK